MKKIVLVILTIVLMAAMSSCSLFSEPAAGPAGPKGDQGVPGAQGPAGPAGAKGATGDVGPAGPQGDTGAQGPAGAQGDKGDTGATGAIGPVGATGPQGEKGDSGVPAHLTALETALFGGSSVIKGVIDQAGNYMLVIRAYGTIPAAPNPPVAIVVNTAGGIRLTTAPAYFIEGTVVPGAAVVLTTTVIPITAFKTGDTFAVQVIGMTVCYTTLDVGIYY